MDGELTIAQAAREMGVSHTWAGKLLKAHRRGVPGPAQLRVEMEKRLASEAGAVA